MRAKPVMLWVVILGTGALLVWMERRARAPRPASGTVVVVPPPTAPRRLVQAPSNSVAATPFQQGGAPSGRLHPIWGREGESFSARRKALEGLGPELRPEEIQELYAFLHETGARPGTAIGGEHVLKNQVMSLLLAQKPLPADLLPALCDLYRDGRQDSVTRDYALQHLVTAGLIAPAQYAAHREEAGEALWAAVSEADGSLAGTALLGLHRLSPVDASIDADRVTTTALNLAQDPATGELTRVTALQVCGLRQVGKVLPVAAALASSASSVPLRASAIAAVGELGGETEKTFLEGLEAAPQSALQPALRSALARLQQRLQPAKEQAGGNQMNH